jgi:hypothetical protein
MDKNGLRVTENRILGMVYEAVALHDVFLLNSCFKVREPFDQEYLFRKITGSHGFDSHGFDD